MPASLPRLPFPGGRFDLVLSSHFLFTYADRLDLEFHRAALRELHRVARREVRVFPLLEQGGGPFPGCCPGCWQRSASRTASAGWL